MKKYLAEMIGTLWLVLGGCGAAVFACTVDHGIGYTGVSLAFGLTVFTMACAIGHVSGCHLNPAVSVGLFVAGKMEKKDLVPYIVSQVIGGTIGAAIIYLIVSNRAGFEGVGGFASNGFGDNSPEGYNMVAVLVAEVVLTAIFLVVICGATSAKAPGVMAPLAIGLCLTLIHLISIPISNTSVNPARSTATAIFQGGWALQQLWVFWVAPIAGGILGATIHKILNPGVDEA